MKRKREILNVTNPNKRLKMNQVIKEGYIDTINLKKELKNEIENFVPISSFPGGKTVKSNSLMDTIISSAEEVYEILGVGHTEKIYQKALIRELNLRGIECDSELVLPIYYKNGYVGHGRSDIIINRKPGPPIIIELKSIARNSFTHLEIAKLKTYMTSSKSNIGVIINFGQGNAKNCKYQIIQFNEKEL